MKCEVVDFGQTKAGEEVKAYTMVNDKGHSVTVLTLGGIIQRVLMPDNKGDVANVVLGYNTVKEYEELSPFFGCITGRVAGRIAGSTFTIDDETYTLTANEGVNNLHGGPVGLDQRVWEAAEVVTADYVEVVMSYTSEDMDQGFPGTLDMVVTYRLDNEDNLTLSYKATTDKATIVTLTNHSYFNLSGDFTRDILDHELQIPADEITVIGEDSIPVGREAVDNGPFDFRAGKAIGTDINSKNQNIINGTGYDHPFILNKEDGEAIILKDPKSGRKMTVTTSEQALVLYTGNFITKKDYVFDQIKTCPRSGVCLETQYFPNAMNSDFFPTRILRPGEVYLEATTFNFSI